MGLTDSAFGSTDEMQAAQQEPLGTWQMYDGRMTPLRTCVESGVSFSSQMWSSWLLVETAPVVFLQEGLPLGLIASLSESLGIL